VPPTDAREFVEFLDSTKLDLNHLHYSVLALGDSNYPQYCKTGIHVHDRLAQMTVIWVQSNKQLKLLLILTLSLDFSVCFYYVYTI